MANNNKRGLRSTFRTFKKMEQKDIMLMYRGNISSELTSHILQMAESKMDAESENRRVKKKFFHVLVECLQNIHLHLEESGSISEDGELPLSEGIIIISKTESHYHVVTGNYINTAKVPGLRKKIMRVNRLDSDELRKLYQATLTNNEFSDKGTAGLGLIDIARKSRERIWFHFDPADEDYSFFAMESRVPREAETKDRERSMAFAAE